MRQAPVVRVSAALALSFSLAMTGCRPQPAVIEGGSGGAGTSSGSGGAATTGSGGGTGSGGAVMTSSGGHTGGGSSGSSTGGAVGSGGVGTGSGGGMGSGASTGKMACQDTTPPADPKMPGYSSDQHTMYANMATALLANMSNTEKADQMRGTPQPATSSATYYDDIFRQVDNTTHNIKGLRFRDGPRGVNLDAPINGGGSKGRSTVFPVAAARGATFDVDLEYQIGQAMGDEMVAAGQTMLLAPTTNILRHPLWGRSQETYGEDVYLLGRLGTASVAGIQEYVAACAKHYAANNIENSRATKTAAMDERTFKEIYARHFEMMIRDGGVACVMGAYNPIAVTGKPAASCTQNGYLLTDTLRTDFGFQGFTITDWWALSGNMATASGTATTAAAGVNAGLDMELPMAINYKLLETIVGSSITQTQLDTAAERIVEQKFRFNVVTGSGLKSATSQLSGGSISYQPHVDLAERVAREAMVLLQNKNSALPLKKSGKIAVVGTKEDYYAATSTSAGINNRADDINNGTIDFPNGVRVGDVGSSRVDFDPAKAISPAQGIKQAGGSGVTVVSGNDAATASGADAIVVIAGLTPYDEGEEYNGSGDRKLLDLNGKLNTGMQNNLIMQVASANPGKPIIVVLEGGGAININPWKDMVSAVVMAWYPGMVGGQALGELLFGDQNFSGKLPVTWPSDVNQYPTFDGGGSTQMDYYLGYRYLENKGTQPQYPFGYGLSYSGKFQYSNLQVPCSSAKAPVKTGTSSTPGSIVNVTVDVTNSSSVDGTETVLLFVSSSMVAKQLKGFVRVDVPAGKTVTATIPLRIADLKYWDSGSSAWKYPSDPVTIMVGRSSAGTDDTKDDLALTDTLTIN